MIIQMTQEVVRTFLRETNELVHISVDRQTITATPEHPFYVPQKGWTSAIQLRAGDRLVLQNGEYAIVEQVQHEILEMPVAVYNFEVADWHTYFVSDSDVLVHNDCSAGRTEPNDLNEQLAMEQVKSAPIVGAKQVPIILGDPRWPATDGWFKMESIVNTSNGKITIHFNYNTNTGTVADLSLNKVIIMDILSIKRVWEDMDFFEVEVVAQSKLISASVKSYTTVASINELASRLAIFPQRTDDRYIWENGIKGEDSTPFISLEFWCKDKLGHIAIEVYMELDDGASYNKHNCCFFLETEIGLLNSFGRSLSLLNEQGIGKTITL